MEAKYRIKTDGRSMVVTFDSPSALAIFLETVKKGGVNPIVEKIS